MRNLILYTDLPIVQDIFDTVVSISDLDANGFFTLSGFPAYLQTYKGELNLGFKSFWSAMSYFLYRQNKKAVAHRAKNK
jgi:hypothetical protein